LSRRLGAKSKSFLFLFFKKEILPFFVGVSVFMRVGITQAETGSASGFVGMFLTRTPLHKHLVRFRSTRAGPPGAGMAPQLRKRHTNVRGQAQRIAN
jgi:hypothetical protein